MTIRTLLVKELNKNLNMEQLDILVNFKEIQKLVMIFGLELSGMSMVLVETMVL